MVGYQNNIPNMNMNTKYALIANAVKTRIPFCADGRTDVRAPMFLLMFVFIFFVTHSLTLSFRMGLLIRLLGFESKPNHQRLSPCAVGLGQRIKLI